MDRVIGGVSIRSAGWKADWPVVVAVPSGLLCIAASFWVHGWARLALQIVGGVLALPLAAFVVIMVLGAAVRGLTKPDPSEIQRSALALAAIVLGVWFGAYTPGAPQELLITPAGFIASGYMLRGGRVRQPGSRRRAAGTVALIAAAAGVTGVWLLATV